MFSYVLSFVVCLICFSYCRYLFVCVLLLFVCVLFVCVCLCLSCLFVLFVVFVRRVLLLRVFVFVVVDVLCVPFFPVCAYPFE